VRQPIFRDALEQWRHFEPWLGPLKVALGPSLGTYAGVGSSEVDAEALHSLHSNNGAGGNDDT
jgi:hypothetical protein